MAGGRAGASNPGTIVSSDGGSRASSVLGCSEVVSVTRNHRIYLASSRRVDFARARWGRVIRSTLPKPAPVRGRDSPYDLPLMSSSYTKSIQELMNELARLPGIGMRSAE